MKAIILKYLTEDDLTDLELEQLLDWLKDSKNLKEFQVFVRDNYSIDIVYDNINEEAALQKVKNAIKDKEKPVRKLYWKYAVAASIVLLITLPFIFNRDNTQVAPTIVNSNIEAGTNKATLTLEDGSEVILEKGQTYTADNIVSNGEEIIYKTGSSLKTETVYNYLTIPRGGQYHVKLSDGTEIWLNSESKLKYPTSFIEGKTREISLVYGEAYMEVAENKEAPFIVNTKGSLVEVLGTAFNIRAYSDEELIKTTLVSGKVKNYLENQGDKAVFLEPGMQSIASIENKNIEVAQVDTQLYTAWKDGRFVFRDEELSKIMAMMERWYDIDVSYSDAEVKKINFSLDIRKYESFNKVKQILELTETIDFEIEGKAIKIQKKTN